MMHVSIYAEVMVKVLLYIRTQLKFYRNLRILRNYGTVSLKFHQTGRTDCFSKF